MTLFRRTAAVWLFLAICWACVPKQPGGDTTATPFLDSLSQQTFSFFWETANTENGQLPDRWPSESFSSIAATGFGLSTYLVGVERGYITRVQAAERTLRTLRFLQHLPKGEAAQGVAGHKGFFYHFLDMKTGLRFQQVELSTIDTGLLMAGVLSAQAYFDGSDTTEMHIRALADTLYRAVEWDWAMQDKKVMSMGWHPERGFIDATWRGYNEGMILYILAMGSPTHTISSESWKAWTDTYQWTKYQGQEFVNFGPLFGHQYSHLYIDFRGIQDAYMREKGIDYFENSRRATYANRAYCVNNAAAFVGYDKNTWGLTACDGPGNEGKQNPNVAFQGYNARGASQFYLQDDGTIAPTAAGGSLAFAPEICIPALKHMKRRFGAKVYDRYGFKDAFNLSIVYENGTTGWFDKDYLGIDQGPIVLQLENYRSELLWKVMKKSPYIRAGLKKAGFAGGWLDEK